MSTPTPAAVSSDAVRLPHQLERLLSDESTNWRTSSGHKWQSKLLERQLSFVVKKQKHTNAFLITAMDCSTPQLVAAASHANASKAWTSVYTQLVGTRPSLFPLPECVRMQAEATDGASEVEWHACNIHGVLLDRLYISRQSGGVSFESDDREVYGRAPKSLTVAWQRFIAQFHTLKTCPQHKCGLTLSVDQFEGDCCRQCVLHDLSPAATVCGNCNELCKNMYTLSCSHAFCKSCLLRVDKCPNCRVSIRVRHGYSDDACGCFDCDDEREWR